MHGTRRVNLYLCKLSPKVKNPKTSYLQKCQKDNHTSETSYVECTQRSRNVLVWCISFIKI